MARFRDWRERLSLFIVERRDRAFDWGEADCCLTCADSALAMTGEDFAAPLRGYRSAFGAARRLLELGHRSVASYLDTILPRVERPRAGDVVLVPSPPLDVLLIFDRAGAAWGQDERGLVRLAVPRRARFWGVG